MGKWWWIAELPRSVRSDRSRDERRALGRLAQVAGAVFFTLVIVAVSVLGGLLKGHEVISWGLMIAAAIVAVLTARTLGSALWPDEIRAGDGKARERRESPTRYQWGARNEQEAFKASLLKGEDENRTENRWNDAGQQIEHYQEGGEENEPRVEGTTPIERFVFTSFAMILGSLVGVGLFGYKLRQLFPTWDIAASFHQHASNFISFSSFTIAAAFWAFWAAVAFYFLGFFVWMAVKAAVTKSLPPGFRKR